MHPKRKKKLIMILSLFTGLVIVFFLAFFALRSNLDHFYSPTQVIRGEVVIGQRLKIGGLVKEGSVVNSQEDLRVTFVVTDTIGDVTVHYEGILPDLFREGQGIVAKGVLGANREMRADSVLAKHDENYTPAEAAAALMQAAEEKEKLKGYDSDSNSAY